MTTGKFRMEEGGARLVAVRAATVNVRNIIYKLVCVVGDYRLVCVKSGPSSRIRL